MTSEIPTVPAAAPPPAPFRDRSLWVTWERHRRSRELAAVLGVPLVTLLSKAPYALKVVVLSLRTAFVLVARRPAVVFVQNPSMVLAAVACALKRSFRYRLVVDRHSNFRLHESNNPALKWRIFHALSRYTIRAADLTIVTNEFLSRLVEEWGGTAFILPDKIPAMPLAAASPLPARRNVVFICSHEEDEPVQEVLQAAAAVPDIDVYITGDATATRARYGSLVPVNAHLTGYLPEAEYQSLLASCDAVLSLTTAPNTLLCGAYEAVALGKPLVLSDQAALTSYFSKGRVVTDNTVRGLTEAMRYAVENAPRLAEQMRALREELTESWAERWNRLLASVGDLVEGRDRPGLQQPPVARA